MQPRATTVRCNAPSRPSVAADGAAHVANEFSRNGTRARSGAGEWCRDKCRVPGHRGWKLTHVQIGIGPNTSPINQQQNSNAPSGTSIALLFAGPVPALKAGEIKKMMAPVLDFDAQSATDNYFEKLPEPIQKAIKANKVIVGMDRDQVLLAVGRPRHKERNVSKDGSETEDWIYGDPPGKITFVTFGGSKVTAIKEAYADIGGSTAPPLVAK